MNERLGVNYFFFASQCLCPVLVPVMYTSFVSEYRLKLPHGEGIKM